MVKRELQQEHIEKFKKLREKKLHDQIQEKIKYDPKEIEKSREQRGLTVFNEISMMSRRQSRRR